MSEMGDASLRDSEEERLKDEDLKHINQHGPIFTFFMYSTFLLLGAAVLWHSLDKQNIWNASVELSEAMSAWPRFWSYYFWVFSGPLYKWFGMLPALLVLAAPKKDSALRSLFILMLSYWTRILIRNSEMESRPIYDDSNKIVKNSECSCTFGYPSGHSEGSAISLSILIYEFVYQNSAMKRQERNLFTALGIFIGLNVMVSRLYYGMHTIAQVCVGGTLGLSFFFFGILFEKPLILTFRKLLNGEKKAFWKVAAVFILMVTGNLILWVFKFNGDIRNLTRYTSVRCKECFENGLLAMRLHSVSNTQFIGYGLGMYIGVFVLQPKYTKHSSFTIRDLFQMKNAKRVVIMALCNITAALLIFSKNFQDPDASMIFTTVVFLVSGFFTTYGFYTIVSRFGSGSDMDVFLEVNKYDTNNKDLKAIQLRAVV